MKNEIRKEKIASIGIGILLYLYLAFGIFWGIEDFVNVVEHPFLFWMVTFFWGVGFLWVLSLSDHDIYLIAVPAYSADRGISTGQGLLFLFMRRLFSFLLTTIPLILMIFVLIPLGFFLVSLGFSISEEHWFYFFSKTSTQAGFLLLLIFYYWVFGIRFLFVDCFLLEQPHLSILRAFWLSYQYCHWKHWKAIINENKGYFLVLSGGLLFLFLLPVRTPFFWIFLAVFCLGYRLGYLHLKKWEWGYWDEQKKRENLLNRS